MERCRRIVVFSDTHGNREAMEDALAKEGPFDMLLHLGDGVRDGAAAAGQFDLPFRCVYGNEDFGVDTDEYYLLEVAGWSLLMLHGHQLEMNMYAPQPEMDRQYRRLVEMGRVRGADVLLFGHIHQPVIKKVDGMLICNPGDQYRGSSAPPSFALLRVRPEKLDVSVLQYSKAGWIASMADQLTHEC